MKSNFYIDKLLKVVKKLKIVIIFVKSVIKMSKSGGFELTDLVFNSKELLIFIIEHQGSNGVKNADLIVDLLTKNTLGMQWNIFKDSLTFTTLVNDRSEWKAKQNRIEKNGKNGGQNRMEKEWKTKQKNYQSLFLVNPFVLEGGQLLQNLSNHNAQRDNVLIPHLNKN